MAFARVGANTLASQAAARRMPGYATPPSGAWTPSPAVIPSGAYNPTLDIELAAGKRGEQNTLEDLATKEGRGEDNYAINQGEVQRSQGEQADEHQRALTALSRNFTQLGTEQAEKANAAGDATGATSGALAQAAAKRSSNETIQREPIDTAYAREGEADERSLGKLALARQQEAEDDATTGSRAEREQAQFGVDTRTVEAREAANNGYSDEGGVVGRTSIQPGAGFVHVGLLQRKQRGR